MTGEGDGTAGEGDGTTADERSALDRAAEAALATDEVADDLADVGDTGAKKRFTPETSIGLLEESEIDDVYLQTVEEHDLMRVEYDGDEVVECTIDPRILRSALFLYSSMERTRHDWR